MAEFKTNGRGILQLVDSAGFAYSKHYGNANTNSMFWRCEKRQSSIWKCTARATTIGIHIKSQTGYHMHPPTYFGERLLNKS